MRRAHAAGRASRARRTLRLKTRLWLTFTTLLAGAITPLIVLGFERLSSRLQIHARNEAIALARNIAYLSTNSLLNFNYLDLERIANEATREANVRFVLVLDRKGVAVAHNRGWHESAESEPGRRRDGALRDERAAVRLASYAPPDRPPEELLVVEVPVLLENSEERWGMVRVGYSLEPVLSAVHSMVAMAVIISVTVLALGTMGIAILSRHLTRPLEELLAGAAKISKGDYSLKLRVRREDEIGALAGEFNRMAVEIERKQSELEQANRLLEAQVAEVTREKAKLAAILRTVIDGLLVIDGKGRLVLANPAAEEILAFDAASAIGRPIREIVRDERLLVLFTQTVESGVGAQADVSLDDARGLAGGARIMHTRTAAMRSGTGPVRGVVAILQDVTKLRLAERAKSEFVSNVSHELRTPISIMKVGLSNLIRYQDIAAEQRQSLLETISRENHRLEVLISDLLDVSCIEAGSFALRRAEFDLREVVTDVAESLRARADEARLELEATVSAQPVRVLGDRDKLRQVVMNLAVNAIHYTPAAGGRVQLSCRLTEGAALPRAEIQVRDTGVGMPSNVVPHIFERFYRGHASQLTTVPGTGLGLAIVKEIVDAHGGEIRVESRVNEGSTFTVILPASGALPAPA